MIIVGVTEFICSVNLLPFFDETMEKIYSIFGIVYLWEMSL